MAEDLIGYEKLTEQALRLVVVKALKNVKKVGLPGDHHFYISFKTGARGVEIADHLRAQFPDEMTIVIQHQYWDLEVDDKHLEIVLKFSGVPQHLSIPFAALTRFVDPAVNFGLVFHVDEDLLDAQVEDDEPHPDNKSTARADEKSTAQIAPGVVSLDAFRRK